MSKVYFYPARHPATAEDTVSPIVLCDDILTAFSSKEEWAEDGRKTACGTRKGLFCIGPSEAAVLSGDLKFKSPKRLAGEKRGEIAIESMSPESIHRCEAGNWGEEMDFALFNQFPPVEKLSEVLPGLTNLELKRDRRMLQHPKAPALVMNMDGIITMTFDDGHTEDAVWEHKTRNWRLDPDKDGLPYEWQTRCYLAGTGNRLGVIEIVSDFNPENNIWVVVERDIDIENDILNVINLWDEAISYGGDQSVIEQAELRWENMNDEPGIAVANYTALHPVLDDACVDLERVSSDLRGIFEETEEAKKLEAEARKHRKLAEAFTHKVLDAMNGHKSGYADGLTVSVADTRRSTSYDKRRVDKLRKAHPELEQDFSNCEVTKGGNPTVKVEELAGDDADAS